MVSLTVTPAMCATLLTKERQRAQDSPMVRWLKRGNRALLVPALRHPRVVLVVAFTVVSLALGSLAGASVEFLPPFNEGTLTVELVGNPGSVWPRATASAGPRRNCCCRSPRWPA